MRRIKIFFIKLYYYFICLLTDKIRINLLLKPKLLLGAFILSLTLNSCSIFRKKSKSTYHSCHFACNPNNKNRVDKTSNSNNTKNEHL